MRRVSRNALKPAPNSPVNWRNPLTRGLVFGSFINDGAGNPRDLVYPYSNGTINGSVPWSPTSVGLGLSHNASDSNYLDFGNPSKLQFTDTSSFSIYVIATVGGSAGSFRDLFRNDPGGSPRTLCFFRLTDTDVLSFSFGDTAGTRGTLTGSTAVNVSIPRVRHFVGVRDVPNDTIQLYIDGNQEATGADASTGTWTVNASTWMTKFSSGGEPYDGKICGVLVWNRPLSAAEAQSLYLDPWQVLVRGVAPRSPAEVVVSPDTSTSMAAIGAMTLTTSAATHAASMDGAADFGPFASYTAPQVAPGLIVIITNPGSGYTAVPTVTFSGVTGATGVAVLGSGDTAGQIIAVVVTCKGTSPTPPVTVSIAAPSPGPGTTAIAVVVPTNPSSQEKSRLIPFVVRADGYGNVCIETNFTELTPPPGFGSLMAPPIPQPLLQTSDQSIIGGGSDRDEERSAPLYPDIFEMPRLGEILSDPPFNPREQTETSRDSSGESPLASPVSAPLTQAPLPPPEHDISTLLISRPWAVWVDQVHRFMRFLQNPQADGAFDVLCPSVDETDIEWWAEGLLASSVTDPATVTVDFTGESRFPMTASIVAGGVSYATPPTVSIAGANGTGFGATATAAVRGGAVTAITITASGYGYMEPLSFTLTGGGGTGALVAGKVGRQFNVGDFILWNDSTQIGGIRSYEIDLITAIAPIDATSATFTLQRRANGAPAGQAQFASLMRSHGSSQIYRLVNKVFPITPATSPQIYKFLWPDMTVLAAKGTIVGFDATILNLSQSAYLANGSTTATVQYAPPAPGLRTLNGAAYTNIGILGTLEVGATAIARISVQDWESIRSVYGKVRVAPGGAVTFQGDADACVVVYVCYITPDAVGAQSVGLIDTLIIKDGEYLSYAVTNEPDGRMMPYHAYFPLSGTRLDWPPTILPLIEDALDVDGNLVTTGTIDPTQTVTFKPDGEIDIIVMQVGSDVGGDDLIVTVQS